MSKSTKIVVSLLIVAGFVCLAIGTIFACDYISQSNSPVALAQERVIVASANRYSMPNVKIDKPLQDIEVPVDGFAPGYYRFDLSVVVPYDDFNDTFKFARLTSPDLYYDFTLVSTNIEVLDSYIGDLIRFDFYFDSQYSFARISIESTDGDYARSFSLDGSLEYSFEVQASGSFIITNNANSPVSILFVPSDTFTPVASGVLFVRELFGILVSGLTGIGQGLGESLSPIATAIFVNTAGDGLSVFGILIAVFAAISLGLSFTRFVLNFVTSWGNRNR